MELYWTIDHLHTTDRENLLNAAFLPAISERFLGKPLRFQKELTMGNPTWIESSVELWVWKTGGVRFWLDYWSDLLSNNWKSTQEVRLT